MLAEDRPVFRQDRSGSRRRQRSADPGRGVRLGARAGREDAGRNGRDGLEPYGCHPEPRRAVRRGLRAEHDQARYRAPPAAAADPDGARAPPQALRGAAGADHRRAHGGARRRGRPSCRRGGRTGRTAAAPPARARRVVSERSHGAPAARRDRAVPAAPAAHGERGRADLRRLHARGVGPGARSRHGQLRGLARGLRPGTGRDAGVPARAAGGGGRAARRLRASSARSRSGSTPPTSPITTSSTCDRCGPARARPPREAERGGVRERDRAACAGRPAGAGSGPRGGGSGSLGPHGRRRRPRGRLQRRPDLQVPRLPSRHLQPAAAGRHQRGQSGGRGQGGRARRRGAAEGGRRLRARHDRLRHRRRGADRPHRADHHADRRAPASVLRDLGGGRPPQHGLPPAPGRPRDA